MTWPARRTLALPCFHLLPLILLAGLAATSCRGQDTPRPEAPAPAVKTYIHEFPHPRVVVHYHPRAGQQFTLEAAEYALDHGAHGLELDLHVRGADVVCNHDGPNALAPRLVDVIDLILRRKGNAPTVYNDNRQFFLVLEPKDDDPQLFDGVYNILGRYEDQLSTAVGRDGGPRGITVVITGAYLNKLYDRFASDRAAFNRRCIIEGHDYSAEIVNRTRGAVPFQWMSIRHPDQRGRVNPLHTGTEPRRKGRYNIRVWGEGPDQAPVLAAGVDSVNCDHEQVVPFTAMVRRQAVDGAFPALAIRGSRALLAWRGAVSNDLYIALGTTGAAGLSFPRPILLSAFLAEKPQAVTPAAAILPDGRILLVYEGTGEHRLWTICGHFTDPERFLTFDGGQRRLTPPDDSAMRGVRPAVAAGPDGRAVIVYEAADGSGLKYVAGKVDAGGAIQGTERALTIGHAPRAETPAIAMDGRGRLLLAYRCKDDGVIRYIAGTLAPSGQIAGEESSVANGLEGQGASPAVALGANGAVSIAYTGIALRVFHGLWKPGARIAGRLLPSARLLPTGTAPEGTHPAAAADARGRPVLVFENGDSLVYIPDAGKSLATPERPVETGMDPL